MRSKFLGALALSVLTGSVGASSFTPIDDAAFGFLVGFSHDGRMASGFFTSFGAFGGAFRWRKDAGVEMLGGFSAGMGMSPRGNVVAGAADDGSGVQVAALAYADSATNGPTMIGAYPGSHPLDNFSSQGYGVSEAGVVVGLAYDPSGNPIAYRWTQEDGMTRLPVTRPDTYSRANGISANGSVIYGWNDQRDGYRSGVVWVKQQPIDLHNPYGDSIGAPPGEALGITSSGSVVVGQGYWDELNNSQAWRWTAAEGTQPIGIILPVARAWKAAGPTLDLLRGVMRDAHLPTPNGFFSQPQAYALGVSDDGNVIVGNSGDGITQEAMIWTPASGMVFLADYLAAHGVVVPDGWILLSANAISGDGKTIAGSGIEPTGTTVEPFVVDLHDAPGDTAVIAQGTVTANDLSAGPFAGYPVGAAVSMSFRVAPGGHEITPARETRYDIAASNFALTASYQDPNDFSRHSATESLAAVAPTLHIKNDLPRADGIDVPETATATPGQTFRFTLSAPRGDLFDSDDADRINRSFGPTYFDATTWVVREGTHAMTIALQWVAIQDDAETIFRSGFDGG